MWDQGFENKSSGGSRVGFFAINMYVPLCCPRNSCRSMMGAPISFFFVNSCLRRERFDSLFVVCYFCVAGIFSLRCYWSMSCDHILHFVGDFMNTCTQVRIMAEKSEIILNEPGENRKN